MKHTYLRLAGLLFAVGLMGLNAATTSWQGGEGDWTNANWNVNGVANQTIVSPPTTYTNINFIINLTDSTLVSASLPALDGGSWIQDSGTVVLAGGGNNPGAAFGINGTSTTVVLSEDAQLEATGSGTASSALVGRAGSLALSNNASVICTNLNLEIQNGFSVTLQDDSSITAPYLYFSTTEAANALLSLNSGTITLTGSNPLQTPLQGSNPPGNRINITGPAGSAQVINTDNSNAATNLAAKLATGFFCIDGTLVTNTSTSVDGRRINITTAGSTDTLQLVNTTLAIDTVPSLPVSTLAENSTFNNGESTRVNGGKSKGQTIAFTKRVSITNLIFMLDDVVTSVDLSGWLTLEIYKTLNGLPVGNPVYSNSGVLPASLTNGALMRIVPNLPIRLTAGRYAFALSTSDADLNFKLSTGDTYGGGALVRSSNGSWDFRASAGIDFVFGLNGVQESDPPVPANRPNILVILADDLGWTDISAGEPNMGHISDFYQTPNIARLAQEGLSFTSCYMCPNCAPSRAALLSGQYASRSGNGVFNVRDLNRSTATSSMIGPAQNEDVPAASYTMAEMLRDAGYVNAHLGKWHVGDHEGGSTTLPLNQGFNWNFGGTSEGNPLSFQASSTGVFDANIGPELDWYGLPYQLDYINTKLIPFANNFNPLTINGNNKHLEDAEADAAIAYISDHLSGPLANRPFYLQWHSYAVHSPYLSRADIKAKYAALAPGVNHTDATYAGLVEGLDQAIGRVMAFLEDPNGDGIRSDSIASNTIVIFSSDNGGNNKTNNNPLRAYKGTLFEGGIRVPLIVRWPGRMPANEVTDTIVQNVDFYPTLMELAGGSTTQILDGVSFASHMQNPVVPRNRGSIFHHFPGYLDNRARPSSMIIKEINSKRYKLIYNYDYKYDPTPNDDSIKVLTQPWELYNLTDDLSETKNLIDGTYTGWLIEGSITNQMAAELNAWLTQSDPTWNAKQPTYRSSGAVVPYAPASVPDIPPSGFKTFQITSISINSATKEATLTWNSESGFVYSVWVSSDLQGWSLLQENIDPAGSSTSRTVADPDIGTRSRHYRIAVNRP